MADYASFLYNSLNGIGDTIADNRARALAQNNNQRDYAQRLFEDQRDFGFRQSEAERAQRNTDRDYALQVRTANRLDAQLANPQTDDIKEWMFARKNGYTGSFTDFLTTGKSEYGLTPVYAADDQGNVIALQPSKAGGVRQLDAPAGYRILSPGDKSAQQAAGKVEGVAAVNLPLAEASADRIVRGIDDALSDPGLSRVTGPIQSWLPNVTSAANRAQSRLDQIQGGAFLQAYNDLRGGGAITEKEGEKATEAYNRLSETGMSDEDYRQALAEFKNEVVKLVGIARQRAGQGRKPGTMIGVQPSGGVVDFRDYFGGGQ